MSNKKTFFEESKFLFQEQKSSSTELNEMLNGNSSKKYKTINDKEQFNISK